MNTKFLRLMIIASFVFHFNDSTAGAWEKGVKRIVILMALP